MPNAPIPRATLGRTGERVTRLGIGLAAVGRPAYINLGRGDDLGVERDRAAMEARAHAVLDAAWDAGIRYVDAARSYGDAEAFLGSWLRTRPTAAVESFVASKWGYEYVGGWRLDAAIHETKDHGVETFRRQWEETRGLIGDHVELYQIHSATLESGVLEDSDVHEELAQLRVDAHKRIGLSLSGPRQAETLRRALAVRVRGTPLFDTVQATWNVLEPSVGRALAEAHATGVGVIVKEALANGRLALRDDDPAFAGRAALIAAEAARLGTTPDAFALAAALSRPWVDVVLLGAATPAQVRSNAAALEVAWDGAAEGALARLAEEPEAYWARRSRLSWS